MLMTYDFGILRELRKKRKMTIAQLSERSGVSYVAISKLERNQGNPELKTLDRISQALEMPTHNLLALAEQKHPVRAEETTCALLETAECRHVNLDGLRIFVITAPKGAHGRQPEFHKDDYEHCYLLSGKVKISIRGSDYTLKPGQALSWDCIFEHQYEALENSQWVAILTPKRP
jgi:transcriptional regulator with XRE-family HTH domain